MVDIEKIVIDYINDKLNDNTVYVSDEVPNPRPSDKMVIVEAAGGQSSYTETIDTNTVAIQTYAPTRLEAYNLAIDVHDILPDMADEVDEVATVGLNLPINWTEREPRYQLVVIIKTIDYL